MLRRDLHEHYDQLTDIERLWVDDQFRAMFHEAKHIGIKLLSDDRAEVAVDAVARWIIVSREKAQAETVAPRLGGADK